MIKSIYIIFVILVIIVILFIYNNEKMENVTTISIDNNENVVTFPFDNNVQIIIPNINILSRNNTHFIGRPDKEILFRKIHTYLISNKILKNNIIDLGAFIGDNAVIWAKNIEGIVYAIDPSHDNITYIKQLCILNNINNVVTIEKAISDKNEVIATNDDLFHASFIYNEDWTDKNIDSGKNKVNACTLDYLYDSKIIDNIGCIHLDVEGMEFKVVLGADNIIKKFRPIISFEQHTEIDNYKELINHVKKYNYDVYKINEKHNGRHDCINFLSFPIELITPSFIDNINTYLGTTGLTQF